jgi:hypothetical protein
MPWYQSVEQISKLILLVAGVILLIMGQTETGLTLLGFTGWFVAANVVDKKRKNGKGSGGIAVLLLCCCLVFASGGCQMMQNLPGEVVALNLQVYDVYDEYVTSDPKLDEFSRQQLLRSTSLLRQIMLLLQGGATSIDFFLLQQAEK